MRGPFGHEERNVMVRPQFVPVEKELLKFRRQGPTGDREPSVRPTKLSKRVGNHLTLDHDRGGCEEDETEQKCGPHLHGSVTATRSDDFPLRPHETNRRSRSEPRPIVGRKVVSELPRIERVRPLVRYGIVGFALGTIKVVTTKTPSVRA